ncbi:MAG: hypothetical protein J2P25_06805 [Nocardiopsaceae bacterium]|nr:hypothetical protein [Nocardiopsaceae bacterium]
MTPRDAIEAAEVAGAESAYRLQLAREMYEAGHADGYAAGFDAGWRHSEADMAAWWRQTGHAIANRPTHAELEERRWGPGGREHFADPRPGDFPGQGSRPRPEPETQPEMEATP